MTSDSDRYYNRVWGAMMLTPHLDVCRSILMGERVVAGRLDPVALRRALRGMTLPKPTEFVLVTAEMLDAIVEGGAFRPRG